jgi:hypothetical protein
MSTDEDLAAVRELRAGPAEPTDLAVARVRARVTGSIRSTVDGRRTGTRPTWFAVASAALAVVAVMGLVAVVGRLRDRAGEPIGVAPTAQAPTPVGPTPNPPAPANIPALESVVTPVVPAPGQLLYVRQTTPSGEPLSEAWVDPEGGLELLRTNADPGNPPFELSAGEVDAAKAELRRSGPSLNRPTPAYLQSLPTDPATLYARIADQLGRSGGGTLRADLVFKNSIQLLRLVEPMLSPASRAAYLEALARAPGATVDRTPRPFAGRQAYVVQQVSSFGTAGFIVDIATGRIIGAYASGAPGDLLEQAEHWEYGVVNKVGELP